MSYIKIIIKYIALLFIMSVALFILTRFLPVGPIDLLLQQLELAPTVENKRVITAQLGLDKPLYIQYIKWIGAFIKGDWGRSLITKQDIRAEIFKAMPYSLTLGLGGITLAAVLGFFTGYLAALKKGGFFDRFTAAISLFSQSIPTFILSVIIIYYIGVKYKLAKIFTGDIRVKITLAILMVMLSSVGSIARIMRKHFLDIKKQAYIRAEVARGFLYRQVLLSSGLRPALMGLCSAMISKFSWVIGGTAVVEFVFAVPGVSFFLVNSIAQRDYNVIQSYMFFIVLWMLMVHLVFLVLIRALGARK